ncbi:MAG TPA: lysylphosphatidylglycerol synthase transmembrane domain-containing protein [Vicinamibacterales bacterium]|nr:lysylphosphatidylglycerol synthase transmembrane domain-containing protein [Vicinamibacterales bacterium]
MSAAVIAILLAFVPVAAVAGALSRVRPWTWIAAVVIFFAGHYLNAVKLWLLMSPGVVSGSTKGQEVPFSQGVSASAAGGNDARAHFLCVRAQYAGLVANLALPGIAGGDLMRAAYLAPTVGLARVTVASIADRIIDTATLFVLIAIALPLAGLPPAVADVVRQAGLWIAVAIPAAVAAFLAVRLVLRRPAIAAKFASLRSAFRAGVPAILGAVAISLAVQSAFVMTNVWLAREVGVTTALAAWFVAWPLSKLIAILPISLGGLGVREAALVSLLAPYGASNDAVLASGILWQSVLIVTGFVGLAVTQLLPQAPGTAPAARGVS